MDIQNDLVLNPKLQHIQWHLYPIQVIDCFPPAALDTHPKPGLETRHRGVRIAVEFFDSLGKYSISMAEVTIAVIPKIDALLMIEQLILKIDSTSFVNLLLGRVSGYSKILGYKTLLEEVSNV
ncbi:MAG: hypothetical protein MH252_00280 [Thermosynechococcaceae cyanobacterium MS004]|nr:hypothetical protein [Thermosynechococcaceae cyanobacterium MS004]